ncbi:PGF-CTERM-anchored ABC transporter substrate-binding protein [Halovivax gelatinilyticus]|uniref:PGF-CTERM-anchored ABC transporter substrate-binding protein n=1 Tax=Halovivax gelatinilyticus TaxID=2961597 RepID=UPI0020CA5CC7|nr:PGF-CTERM-anchored ABC transporter substrate-binding protein [Halovivax gelatinilyticus]
MRTRTILLVALLVSVVVAAPGTAAVAPSTDAQSVSSQPECSYPVTMTDVTGTDVTLSDPPETVVATQASDVQLMAELEVGTSLVGMPVGQYTDHLDVTDDVTDISEDDEITPVAETIIDLDADVVIAANTVLFVDGFVEQLREADQTVYVYDSAETLEAVQENVRLAGVLTNECDAADASVAEMNERLDVIDEVVAQSDERPLAYYVMGEGDLTTAGVGTFQHEILERAGVENIAERADIDGWEEISEEVVIAEDPEWLIYGDYLDGPPEMTATEATTAWDTDQFVEVDSNQMSQPGPQVVDSIETIASTVHEDTYAEVTRTQESTDAADGDDETDNGSAGDDDVSDDSSSDEVIPGFGIAAAVIALLAIVAFGRRRL